MDCAEEEARKRGFAYLYLFTEDQQGFYEKLGYRVCERIQAVGKVAKLLDEGALVGLMKHFAVRSQQVHAGAEDVAGENDIWLRKPLCETLGSAPTVRDMELQALLAVVQEVNGVSLGVGFRVFAADGTVQDGRATKTGWIDNVNGSNRSDLSLSCSDSPINNQSACRGTIIDMTWERQVRA